LALPCKAETNCRDRFEIIADAFQLRGAVKFAASELYCSPWIYYHTAFRNHVDLLWADDAMQELDSGLIDHINQRLREPKFQQQRKALYEEALPKFDKEFHLDEVYQSRANNTLNGRISLADQAGEGDFAHVPAGWLYDMALKITGGNSYNALELIVSCGHDDKNNTFDCPVKTAAFYLPKSLGSSADISESTKAMIAAIQAPNAGAGSLPAKYYHVYTEALLTCGLLKDGVGSALVSRIARLTGKMYRVMSLHANYQDLTKAFARDQKQYFEFLAKNSKSSADVSFDQWLALRAQSPGLSDAIVQRIVRGDRRHYSVDLDALKLFESLADSPLSWWKMDVRSMLTMARARKKLWSTPSDWTELRRLAAEQALMSYLADILWTEEAHAAGAKFAITACSTGFF